MAEQDEPSFNAKQSFSGDVDQVAGRDVVNQHIHGMGRFLTKKERNFLNGKIQKLEAKFNLPGWQTWEFLHKNIGINSINDMKIEHRDPANAIVDLLIENSCLKAEASKCSPSTNQSQSTVSNVNVTRSGVWLGGALIISLAASGIFAFQAYAAAKVASEALKRVVVCSYGDRQYSIGSIIIDKDKSEQVCTASSDGKSPEWKPVKAAPPKRSSQAKVHQRNAEKLSSSNDSKPDPISDYIQNNN